jgi:hypothetical protein
MGNTGYDIEKSRIIKAYREGDGYTLFSRLPKDFKNDKQVVIEYFKAVKPTKDRFDEYMSLHDTIKYDRDLIMILLQKVNYDLLNFEDFPKNLQNDKEVTLVAVKKMDST